MAIRASKNELVHIENSRINDEVKGGKMPHMPERLGELCWRRTEVQWRRMCESGRSRRHDCNRVVKAHLDGPVIAYSRDD
jgi:hypothetical protein